MKKPIEFTIKKKLDNALGRAGVIVTPHGPIQTPAFVVVGTKATVKGLTPAQLSEIGVQVVLANTYHLYLQPGDDVVKDAGGLHTFMDWHGPTMTDSGGFQVFSLGAAYGKEISKITTITDPNFIIPERSLDSIVPLAKVGNDGVSFKSHLDGSLHYITPEKSIEIQHNLGADIIFAFDECTSPTEDERYQSEALDRTHAWARRSLERHIELEKEKSLLQEDVTAFPLPLSEGEYPQGEGVINQSGHHPGLSATPPQKGGEETPLPQALFGIVQGGRSEALRKKSAEMIGSMDFDGFGIGGSFAKEDMSTAVKWVNEILPEDKPRHLLGIGEPEDLFMGVENGVDLFDCVGPTRIGRNGMAFTKHGKINLFNAQFVRDYTPIDEGCGCYTCSSPRSDLGTDSIKTKSLGPTSGSRYTRSYISHLFRAKEMEAGILLSIHNIYFLTNLVARMRQAILDDTFFEFKEDFLSVYKK